MIIKKLNEGDLHNFECISQYGFSKINKKLELDQVEHKKIIIQKHDSILTLFHDKKQTNKINKNIIKLVDLNIHTEYSPSLNEVQINSLFRKRILSNKEKKRNNTEIKDLRNEFENEIFA